VVIPVAGLGKRMRPLTHTTPKPLLRLAGKTVLERCLDSLKGLEVSELILITGYLGERFKEQEFLKKFNTTFLTQHSLNGSAASVALALDRLKEDVLVIFGDAAFDLSVQEDLERCKDCDGVIWVQEVEDYSRFGIVLLDEEGFVKRIVEKPDEPYTKLANIGLYYFKNPDCLRDALNELFSKGIQRKGEYDLPTAISLVASKHKFRVVKTSNAWFDAGKPETFLESQRHFLTTEQSTTPVSAVVKQPVYVEPSVVLEDSVIGPNVAIHEGSVVKRCVLSNCSVGERCVLEDVELHNSLIGDGCVVKGFKGEALLADDSEVRREGDTRPRGEG